MMTHTPHIQEHVHLMVDIPELGLHRGESGLVCSEWFSPATAFEIEFREPGLRYPIRALVRENQIESDEPPPRADA